MESPCPVLLCMWQGMIGLCLRWMTVWELQIYDHALTWVKSTFWGFHRISLRSSVAHIRLVLWLHLWSLCSWTSWLTSGPDALGMRTCVTEAAEKRMLLVNDIGCKALSFALTVTYPCVKGRNFLFDLCTKWFLNVSGPQMPSCAGSLMGVKGSYCVACIWLWTLSDDSNLSIPHFSSGVPICLISKEFLENSLLASDMTP